MQLKDVYELMDRFEKSNLSEMSLEFSGMCLQVKKSVATASGQKSTAEYVPEISSEGNVMPVAAEEPVGTEAAGTKVPAQIAGTFYRAPAPDAPPFVKVGQKVKKGDTLGLMEAMKMMSNVVAPVDGEVTEIPVADGTLVSFGTPLFYIV